MPWAQRWSRNATPMRAEGTELKVAAIILQSMADFETLPVSVVVVTWNRRSLLEECLRSLATQLGVTFEVIVVDNGSTDGSAEAVTSLARDLDLRFVLIRNQLNKGYCEANNQGIAAARGEWVALLNNDAVAQPDWLVNLYSAVKNRREFGMAASKILVFDDPRKIDKAGHLIFPDGQNRGRGSGQLDTGQFDREEEILWPDGCAAIYRKSMLDEIGGFDEDLFAYGDDAELGMRARIAGWKCLYVPGSVVWHHRASTFGVLSTRRLVLIERNRLLLALKHFPLKLLCLNWAYFLLRIGAGVWAAVRGKGEVGRWPGAKGKLQVAWCILSAQFQALLMAPRTVRKRRAIRSLRRLSSAEITGMIFRHRITLKELSEQAI